MAVEIENRAHLHVLDKVSVTGQKVREKTMILIKRCETPVRSVCKFRPPWPRMGNESLARVYHPK